MEIIKQLFIILAYTLLGEIIATISGWPIPGSIYGLILLFISLKWKIIRLSQIDLVTSWLRDNMALLFVPATAGIMIYYSFLKDNLWLLLASLFVSTIITFVLTGRFVQLIRRKTGHAS